MRAGGQRENGRDQIGRKIGQIEHLLRDCVQQAAVDAQAPDCEALAHIEHRNLPVAVVVLPSRRA